MWELVPKTIKFFCHRFIKYKYNRNKFNINNQFICVWPHYGQGILTYFQTLFLLSRYVFITAEKSTASNNLVLLLNSDMELYQ
jgi:hypothetical protein